MNLNELVIYIKKIYESDFFLKKLSTENNIYIQILLDEYFNEHFIPEIKIILKTSKIVNKINKETGDIIILNDGDSYEIATTKESYQNHNQKLVWRI